jgi:hypothetical protein
MGECARKGRAEGQVSGQAQQQYADTQHTHITYGHHSASERALAEGEGLPRAGCRCAQHVLPSKCGVYTALRCTYCLRSTAPRAAPSSARAESR